MTSSPVYQDVAYIHEAGDDGLTRVRPAFPTGSSEWLILSAIIVAASREAEVDAWMADITTGLWRHQARALKFSGLNDAKKLYVCQKLAVLPARYFAVCSNKKNMEGYRNPFAEAVPSRNWFYCWMRRLLLERVTDFVSGTRSGSTAQNRRSRLYLATVGASLTRR